MDWQQEPCGLSAKVTQHRLWEVCGVALASLWQVLKICPRSCGHSDCSFRLCQRGNPLARDKPPEFGPFTNSNCPLGRVLLFPCGAVFLRILAPPLDAPGRSFLACHRRTGVGNLLSKRSSSAGGNAMAFRRSLYSVANSGGDDVVSANGRRVGQGQLASRPGFRADRKSVVRERV